MNREAELLPNYEKQLRYARAHEHLKRAMDGGFHIEAAMICESIITDRLHSHLHWRVEVAKLCTMEDVVARLSEKKMFRPPKKPPEISLEKASLFILILAVGLDFKDHGFEHYQSLPIRLDKWRECRNEIAHNMTYTRPTSKTYDVAFDEFMAHARECATEGKALTAHLTNWDRLVRDRYKRTLKGAGG
ncbi:hypothetical protein Q0M94_25980 (plasmid) [Deinococcus radiomollis]|uniref:hypothetical protein n=1 Tax=Deinococcus radiomollis TaxID=468916 RepID=UPI0038928BF6